MVRPTWTTPPPQPVRCNNSTRTCNEPSSTKTRRSEAKRNDDIVWETTDKRATVQRTFVQTRNNPFNKPPGPCQPVLGRRRRTARSTENGVETATGTVSAEDASETTAIVTAATATALTATALTALTVIAATEVVSAGGSVSVSASASEGAGVAAAATAVIVATRQYPAAAAAAAMSPRRGGEEGRGRGRGHGLRLLQRPRRHRPRLG
jgi:hypothetical protein